MSRSTAVGVAADFLDRRPPRRLGVEVVLEDVRIELAQQRVVRGLQIRDLDRRRPRLAQQVDEQRDARAVAVVDARRVDDDGPRRPLPHRVQRASRQTSGIVSAIESAGQREHTAPVGRVGDCERRSVMAASRPATD